MEEINLKERAEQYLLKLLPYEWHNINNIPKELFEDCISILETGIIGKHRTAYSEMFDYLFMKTRDTTRSHIVMKLKEIEDNISRIEWIWIRTKDDAFITSITKEGNVIKEPENKLGDSIHILTHFEWLFNNALNIKIKYRENGTIQDC